MAFLNVWHCLESDVVTNPEDHPRFQAVFVGRTASVTALALRDVVVAFCPMEDFFTTSSSATQLLLFKVCVNRRKTRLVLVETSPRLSSPNLVCLSGYEQGHTPQRNRPDDTLLLETLPGGIRGIPGH